MFHAVNNATRVQVEARLVGVRTDHGEDMLELDAAGRTFVARLRTHAENVAELEPGSTLRLTGVLATAGGVSSGEQHAGTVELLLDSVADLRVIARPAWWTLRRMLAVLGALVAGLIFAAVWITQLRRRVEERTAQLQREIHEREQAERLRQVAEEKSRIARDLHDDLGSSLTEISLLANVAKITGQTPSQAGEQFGVIASKAHSMVSALDVIVWAVDPEENNLQSLADYLAGYAAEFLAASGLECRFKIPPEFPEVTLDGRTRHEVFLAVKEALNNVVRHAQARSVELTVSVEKNVLQVTVADDGRGFDLATVSGGHGVGNLQKRLAALGGDCHIRPQPEAGTKIEFHLPLRA
jgi:signal transduction histidine kinase